MIELLMSGPGQETGFKFPAGFQGSDLALGSVSGN